MTRASLEAFRRKITVDWPAQQERAAKAHLIATARTGHARIMREQEARAGYKPDWDAYANRPGNTILESVVLPGPIVFRYRYHREIVSEAIKALRAASPFVSGTYVRSHEIFVDGVRVDELPRTMRTGAQIMIVNVAPYARRIEIGKTKAGRTFVIQVPDRIYERAAQRMRSKYKNIGDIRFNYVDLPAGYIAKGKLSPTYGVKTKGELITQRKRRQKAGVQIKYPAIFVEV